MSHVPPTNEWVMSHQRMNESCPTNEWMSHVPPTNEQGDAQVVSRKWRNEWMSHVPRVNEWVMSHESMHKSCPTNEWDKAMHKSCPTNEEINEWVMSHVPRVNDWVMSHESMHKSCLNNEWTSRCISRVPQMKKWMNESCPTNGCTSHVSTMNEQVDA